MHWHFLFLRSEPFRPAVIRIVYKASQGTALGSVGWSEQAAPECDVEDFSLLL